jgi:hypothetical protein
VLEANNKGLKGKATRQLLFCVDDINLLGENTCDKQKDTRSSLLASMDICVDAKHREN